MQDFYSGVGMNRFTGVFCVMGEKRFRKQIPTKPASGKWIFFKFHVISIISIWNGLGTILSARETK